MHKHRENPQWRSLDCRGRVRMAAQSCATRLVVVVGHKPGFSSSCSCLQPPPHLVLQLELVLMPDSTAAARRRTCAPADDAHLHCFAATHVNQGTSAVADARVGGAVACGRSSRGCSSGAARSAGSGNQAPCSMRACAQRAACSKRMHSRLRTAPNLVAHLHVASPFNPIRLPQPTPIRVCPLPFTHLHRASRVQ